jgi:4-amino-4-deoxy-L-arabinose transferase-like glycosyltransferase
VKDRKQIIRFIVILAVIHAVYFVLSVNFKGLYMADSYEYMKQAENLKSAHSFYCGDLSKPINNDLYTRRPPLYGFFIFISNILFNSDLFIIILQSLISIVTLTGLYILLREYENRKYSYLFLPLFLLLFPPQFITSNFIMAEILMQAFVFWSFYSFVKFLKTGKVHYIYLYNVFLTLGVLTKPVLLFFWIPNILFSVYLYYKHKKSSFLWASAIQPAVVLLICLMNMQTTGYFHYSSLKDNNLLYYNGYFILVNTRDIETANREIADMQKYLFGITDYKKMSEERERMGLELINNNKMVYAKLHMKGVLNYFFDPGRFDFLNFTGQLKEKNNEGMMFTFAKDGYIGIFNQLLKQNPILLAYLLLVLIMNIVLFAGFAAFLFKRKINIDIKIYLALMVLFLGFMSGPLGTLRYKIHIIPLMLFGLICFMQKTVKSEIEQ